MVSKDLHEIRKRSLTVNGAAESMSAGARSLSEEQLGVEIAERNALGRDKKAFANGIWSRTVF